MVAEMQGRDLLRRKVALIILVALPLAFYLAMRGNDEFAPVAGGIGMAWSVAGAALFSVLSARRVDPRLVLSGFHPWILLLGRMLLLDALAAALVIVACALIVTTSRLVDPGFLVLGVALASLVGVPLGLAVATVMPRELEGMLVIIGVVGITMSLPTESSLAPFLPLYGPLKLLEAASGSDLNLFAALAHGLAYSTGLVILAVLVWTRRVRIRRVIQTP